MKKRKNKTPTSQKLYNFIIERKWDKAMLQLARCPEEAKCWIFIEKSNDMGNNTNQSIDLDEEAAYACHRLPIHRACANKPPVDIIVALHSAYPDAVMYREKYGMLPLHVACNKGASVEVIDTLISQYPQSVKERDCFGLLPIHVACTEGASIEVIKKLLRAYPESAEEKDNSGMKPEKYVGESFHPNKSEVLKALRRVPAYWAAKAYISGQVGVPLYSLLKTKEWSAANLFLNEKPESAGIWIMDDSSSWSDGYPCTPLHVACSNGAPDDLIKRLIKLYPDSVNLRGGRYDMLPLHAACTYGASLHSTKALIDASPSSVKEAESFGLLPLHVAICAGISPVVIRHLFLQYSEGADVKDLKGNTPKDYANLLLSPNRKDILEALRPCPTLPMDDQPQSRNNIILEKRVDVVSTLLDLMAEKRWEDIPDFLRRHPEQSKLVYFENRNERPFAQFPIHRICSLKPKVIAIKALIEAHPTGLKSKTDYNEFPLHIACKNGASLEVIKLLLESFKEAVDVTDVYGRTPLHMVAIAGTDPSILKFILKNSSSSVKIRDSKGLTALEYIKESHHLNKEELLSAFNEVAVHTQSDSAELYGLVKNKRWDEILPSVKKNPAESSIWVFDEEYGHGRLALHLACSLNAPRGIIAALHNSNPKAISTAEKNGRYPLHVACENGADIRVIQLLINVYPDSLFLKDDNGRLPFHYALSRIENIEIVKLLLRAAANFNRSYRNVVSSESLYNPENVQHSSNFKLNPNLRRRHSTSAVYEYKCSKYEQDECDEEDNFISPAAKNGQYKFFSKSQSVKCMEYDDGTINILLSSLLK